MDFTKLSDQQLEELNKKYQDRYSKYFFDNSLSLDQKKLSEVIKKVKLDKSPQEETVELKDFVREYVFRKLKDFAFLVYLAMDKRKHYGPMGEQRVSISFCRNILSIPNDREVTQFDADRFRRLVDEADEKYGKKGGDAYLGMVKKFTLNLLGQEYDTAFMDNLDKFFQLIGAEYSMYSVHDEYGMKFIFADMEFKKIENNLIFWASKELIRSPQFVLSIAAEGLNDYTLIRRESCEVIFFNKWQKFFDQSKMELKKALNHKNSAIREGIKQKALAAYNVSSAKETVGIRQQFIDEMMDGILWHEMGHKASYNDTDSIHLAFGSIFTESDTVGSILKEAMADWAPHRGDKRGALTRFLEISEKDKNKATRDIYVYLSDNWFVDEEEEFMPLQTDVLTALTLNFIKIDGSVDFERMRKEKDALYQFLVKRFGLLCDKLISLIKSSQYQIGIHNAGYDLLEKEVHKMYQNSRNARPINELLKFAPYWVNIVGYLRKFSPEGWKTYQDILQEESANLRLMILKVLTKGDTVKYNNSLREYIYQRYKEIGVLQEPKLVEYKEAVLQACQSMKMPEKVVVKVSEQFEKIMKGENFDISINYEGEKDPFIAVIQEIMIKSGYGDIKAGMVVGELFNPEDTAEKRKEYIRDELENIRDQIEAEMYMEIEVLKVNQKYNLKPMVEELLETTTFFDSKKLKDKIKEIKYEDLKTEAIFEVFVPLKRGYLDWNTSQAVWRINQDLRPDEFIMQWTMDKEFIEALVSAY